MNITVIGASAGIGLETVKRALQRKHQVTTLSRSEIPLQEDGTFTSIRGSALDKVDLQKAIQHADAVIVALGTGKSMKATTLFSDFAKLLVEVRQVEKRDIPFLFVTGFGTGESQNYVTWFVRMFLKYFLKDVYVDKAKMEETLAASSMKWIFVRPGRLLDEPVTEKYRVETTLYKGINIGGINRSDVADFLVKQAENPTVLGKFVAISAK
jgi:putative NADH-flavin reductase